MIFISACAYGDYTDRCYSIARRECYGAVTTDSCCETCSNLANNQLPGMTNNLSSMIFFNNTGFVSHFTYQFVYIHLVINVNNSHLLPFTSYQPLLYTVVNGLYMSIHWVITLWPRYHDNIKLNFTINHVPSDRNGTNWLTWTFVVVVSVDGIKGNTNLNYCQRIKLKVKPWFLCRVIWKIAK